VVVMSVRHHEVVIQEPCDFVAEVLFKGGQVERYPISGDPSWEAPYNEKRSLLVRDGRVIELNWREVIRIEFAPQGKRDKSYWLPEESAKKIAEAGGRITGATRTATEGRLW
jgi:hypothetical protein